MPAPNRPPGVYDRPPAEAAEASAVAAMLTSVLSRFGYQTVETPLIEYSDLFLTKSGDEAINRLFTFELYGRQLCLRSEFTAPAARLYVERFQHEPKPIRWQFSGPVFRYESPGRGHSRQFTMIGAELIGASGAAGDAETIGMAVQGLNAAGVRDWRLMIGHVGLVSALLDRFNLDRRTRRLILGQMENLRRPGRGRKYVEKQYEQMIALTVSGRKSPVTITSGEDDLTSALELLLESANLGTTGTGRTNEDVARRLLTKQQRAEQQDSVMAALDVLEQLTAVRGAPQQAFSALEALIPPEDTNARTLFEDFRHSVDLLTAYDVDASPIDIQMGLARGVNYYTGIVFEIHSQDGDQLCGGGRYDDFIRLLGAGQETPAIGFMFGLERVIEEARRAGFSISRNAPQVLIAPIDEVDNTYAAQVATQLRAQLAVELYPPPNRSTSQAYTYASRKGIPYVLVLGERERTSASLSIRDVRSSEQTTRALSELPAFIREVLS